jgi:translation elongation factor P/translation initiation factor 5A
MTILKLVSLFLLASGSSAFSPVAFSPRQSSTLGVAVDTSDIKNGMTLELDGEPYKVLSFSIMKQARGAAKTTIKVRFTMRDVGDGPLRMLTESFPLFPSPQFKNLIRGSTIENTYRSGEKFETALIEKKSHQFTYAEGVSAGIGSAIVV